MRLPKEHERRTRNPVFPRSTPRRPHSALPAECPYGTPLISETYARWVISTIPETSWIRKYCNYAETQTSANLAYSLGVGLTAMAAAVPPSVIAPTGFPAVTYANFYTMLVGSSGEAQKGLALNPGRRVLEHGAPDTLGSKPASPQALSKSLQTNPHQVFFYPEGGSGLLGGRPGDMLDQLRKKWTDLFDGGPDRTEYADGSVAGHADPRPSMLVGCTPIDLEYLTTLLDWQGGFLSRFFIVVAERERPKMRRLDWPEMRDYLGAQLRLSITSQPGPWVGMTAEAEALWEPWMQNPIPPGSPERLHGALSRSTLIAAKASLILAWSQGFGWGGSPFYVDDKTMQAAINIGNLHAHSILGLGTRIAPSPEIRTQRIILRAIQASGANGLTLGSVTQVGDVSKKGALSHIETLREQGAIYGPHLVEQTPTYWAAGVAPVVATNGVAPPVPPLQGHEL